MSGLNKRIREAVRRCALYCPNCNGSVQLAWKSGPDELTDEEHLLLQKLFARKRVFLRSSEETEERARDRGRHVILLEEE